MGLAFRRRNQPFAVHQEIRLSGEKCTASSFAFEPGTPLLDSYESGRTVAYPTVRIELFICGLSTLPDSTEREQCAEKSDKDEYLSNRIRAAPC